MRIGFLVVLLVCLASVAEARGRFFGGRYRQGGSTGTSNASLNAPVDKAPTYEVELQLLRAVNRERERYGLVPLVLDRTLHLLTRRHCGWMANSSAMVHSGGPTAENIAMGQGDVEAVMQAWMNSSGHRANILNPSWRKIGVSGYRNGSGTPFWCQQFSQ